MIEHLLNWFDNRNRITRQEWVKVQRNLYITFNKLCGDCETYLRLHGRDVVYMKMEHQLNQIWAIGMEMEWSTHRDNPEPAVFRD